ncbi:MAG: hypothetical protein IJ542_02340 [Clostridia bacterium]|nr:hypothetical protein [Clostridia bacterium]
MANGLLCLTLLVTSNVMLTNGFGALGLQRNKSNLWFVLYNTFTMILVILACSSLYALAYVYLLIPYNLERLGILIIVMFSAISNFGVLEITKLVNKEMYYYYDATYSFVVNMGLTIGIMFVIDYSGSFGESMVYACLVSAAYAVATLLFAFAYSRMHNQKISRIFRPVPITILTMSIMAMIIYAISISI